ncbi:MAG: glycine cleavage system aminomethyltransferase GcvT [Candidatus Promineifilaceae bacterium]|nr:glycine cleavage system aminomethyltransferase GcvT [Candidatus Promineifilaceae bacterium]
MTDDFIFEGSLEEVDPRLHKLLQREGQRQLETIILIPSESAAPDAVRDAMASEFGNIYAEGYPREESRQMSEEEILDVEHELAYYRRYSDPRYYKGVEYADVLEALARRRAAELFAANDVDADDLYVNVQPLSGAPANNAVYSALLEPGDTIMGLDLNYGGHLTHGSPVNRSGQLYNAVPYFLDEETEELDYEAIEARALDAQPQLVVAGYSAYPCQINWRRFRAIADRVGATLLADISHISGLVAAGVHPSPIGVADVVTTTTHKSLCGPRGAMILTHRRDLVRRLDRAVFPGEQGGPHLNTIAAMAVAFKLAQTEQFRALQQCVVDNAGRLAQRLQERELRLVSGGSENHLLLVDVRSSIVHEGVPLTGDMAARILDVAGIVTNRNTIPGDVSAFSASGVRMGTVWISQLGFGAQDVDRLGEAIATVLHGCRPFYYVGLGGKKRLRSKVKYQALEEARAIVRELTGTGQPEATGEAVSIRGESAVDFLNYALTSDVPALEVGVIQPTHLFGGGDPDDASAFDARASLRRDGESSFTLRFSDVEAARRAAGWLRDLSDGYVQFDDLYAKLPGPVVVVPAEGGDLPPAPVENAAAFADAKPYFVGQEQRPPAGDPLPLFEWPDEEEDEGELRRTTLYDTHVEMGARIVPFGGWEMPVWYTSVSEEHSAVRESAGLFDVSHMGVLEASGPHAARFLNLVTTNDVDTLDVGQSHYTYLLKPDGSVIDDLLVYRRGPERFMLVVNAANNDRDWAWLTAVNEGRVRIDHERPWVRIQHPATLRDLRDPQWGDERRVDLALQGPRATDVLLALGVEDELARQIRALPWAGLVEGRVGDFDLIVSRTGYTGERVAYELFVHPDEAPALWRALLEAGEPYGLKPAGLAARDSTRTEAGLPLYGHELGGPLDLHPGEAGFASYVKLWQPFFVGRDAYIARERAREQVVVRFRMNEKGVRRPELGDPVLDRRGRVVGTVTSCAIDSEGYLLGQAVVPLAFAEPETLLSIYQLGGGKRSLRVPANVQPGARMPVPDSATVLSRFPSRKKS